MLRHYDNGTVKVHGAHTLHNQVHIYMDGTMSDTPFASNDPIFMLHHCNIDRLFESWIRLYGTPASALPVKGAPPGHNLYDHIVPFFPPYSHASMFKPSRDFGYVYEKLHESDGGSNLGECSSPPSEGVSSRAIWMGVGIALGVVVVVTVVAILLFIKFGPKKPQYLAADTGTEMSERT
ncbi:tyrosinase-like [Branchiostoma lanceolatum]|uniref:tyrosinase-like n=1 Tax=Branchiostoma lanceolatum TaxID=7740 RepID=UPI00345234B6